MNEPQLDETWDLGEVVAERAQPTDEVTIYLNEVASHEKGKLITMHSRAGVDKVDEIDALLDDVNAILEKSKYVVHLTAIPTRMREDIRSKSLAKFPLKYDLMGRDEPANQIARTELENNMIWHAQIINVVNPEGKSKRDWTIEQIEAFHDSLPLPASNAIDGAIRDLTISAEKFTVASKDVDFS